MSSFLPRSLNLYSDALDRVDLKPSACRRSRRCSPLTLFPQILPAPDPSSLTHLQIVGWAVFTSKVEVCTVSVSMRVMSAGASYRYLLRSVVAGEGDRALSTPLTRYYAEAGTPPGRWIGSGLAGFGDGRIGAGDQVTEAQLGLLVGLGCDPVTGEGLGRAYPVFKSTEVRVAERVKDLDAGLSKVEREVASARIMSEETARGRRRPVAGYDLTFSAPKSVSVLWGLADANLQEMIVAAHHAAIADVIAFLEREVAATRTGVSAGDGAVAQVAVRGVAAAAFDHWDSRAGDPQLHTHVVISNKVQAALDGRWRSLDGRPMHAAVTALSAYYDAMIADRLTGMLGLEWEMRVRGTNMHPHAEIVGVPVRLVDEFSSRTRDIDRVAERLMDDYVAAHGHVPSDAAKIRLRAQATLATRPEKNIRSLADLTSEWRGRAAGSLSPDPARWAHAVALGGSPMSVRPSDVPTEIIEQIAVAVVDQVSDKRASWRHWNLWAEASRQTMLWRFSSAADREQVVAQIVTVAKERSVRLTPLEPAPSPRGFRRDDGTSVFRPRHAAVYSSTRILAAEDRLLACTEDRTAPRVRASIVEHVACGARDGHRLTSVQRDALNAIAVSGRRVDVLVGPAGAGKTTAMHALRTAWEKQHGRGSVVGLAPSAAAAAVLANDLGIPCENTAMWLTQHDLGRTHFRRDQLVIIDEATLADTAALDRLTAIAADADRTGAKVLLVGDWAQLQSVSAGGAFSMLAQARSDAPELTEIHRFTHAWETTASLDLRAGRPESIAAYGRRDRLRDGTTEEMLNAAYAAWQTDLGAGHTSILVTESTGLVQALNTRARADRILNGSTESTREASLADGSRVSAGDLIITRRNDRTLRTRSGNWVRNGDLWLVDAVRTDGSVVVHHGTRRRTTALRLPPAYVTKHVDLGYAITTHRAQGLTVDTAHVLVSARTTRENLYVAMTRGRDANIAYVALDQPDESHSAPASGDEINARTVLHEVLQHTGSEVSAHQSIALEQCAWTSIAQLAAEYETIAAAAQRPRWAALIRGSGLTEAQAESVITGDSFGSVTAALRRAEACGHDVNQLLPRLVARRDLRDADDIGAVLQHRLRLSTSTAPSPQVLAGSQSFIAGMIPVANGPMRPEMREALDQRRELIEIRAAALAEAAVAASPAWLRRLGWPPTTSAARRTWLAAVATVAAYRDRYQITSDLPLGSGARTEAERADRHRALVAQRGAATPQASGPPERVFTSAPPIIR